MGQQRTSSSTYPSQYGGGFVTPAQYLTEKLCALIARQNGEDLPNKFWQLPKWKVKFRRHIQQVTPLLLIYYPEAISKALDDRRLKSVYSFGVFSKKSTWASDILDSYQEKARIDREKPAGKTEKVDYSGKLGKTKPKKKPTLLGSLRSLDGEEKETRGSKA